MKKTINTCTIEGRVFNHNLSKRVSGPKSKNPGTEFIMGDLDVAVDEEGLNVIPVHFTYITSTGKRVKTYDILNSIIEDPSVTWVQGGKENALKVSISCQIGLNEFVGKNDKGEEEVVSAKRIEGGFINEIMRDADFSVPEKRNTFIADMLVRGVTYHEEETKENGEVYPAYAVVKGYFFDFRGAILPVELRTEKEAGIQFFMANDGMSEPNFRKVWGHIDSLTIKREITEESAFGEASVRTVTRNVKKWVLDGAAMTGYEYGDPDILDDEQMTTKAQERNVHLAEVMNNYHEYLKTKDTKPSAQTAPTIEVKKNNVFNF